MKKRIVSIILTAMLMIGLLPIQALAAENYQIWIGDTPITAENCNDFYRDGGSVHFDPGTGTLVLTNAKIREKLVSRSGDLTIELRKSSTVTAPIEVEGHLTVRGRKSVSGRNEGSLTVNLSGIAADNTLLRVTGTGGNSGSQTLENVNLTLISGDCFYDVCGIHTDGDISMSGAYLDFRLGNAKNSCGILSGGDLILSDGTGGLIGGGSAEETSIGWQGRDLLVSNLCVINFRAGKAHHAAALQGRAARISKTSLVNCSTEDAWDHSYAAQLTGNVTVQEGSSLHGQAAPAQEASVGIRTDGSISLSGKSQITGTSSGDSRISYGIAAGGLSLTEDSSAVCATDSPSDAARCLILDAGNGSNHLSLDRTSRLIAHSSDENARASVYCAGGITIGKYHQVFGTDSKLHSDAPCTLTANTGDNKIRISRPAFVDGQFHAKAVVPAKLSQEQHMTVTLAQLMGDALPSGASVTYAGGTFYEYMHMVKNVGASEDGAGIFWTTLSKLKRGVTGTLSVVVSCEKYEDFEIDLKLYSSLPYRDVYVDNWYYDDVNFCYVNDIMKGTSDRTFSPHNSVNRAMVVSILYRLEGSPAVSGSCPYPDVSKDRYFWDAMIWATQNGIVNGYHDGRFGPYDNVTRQQLAAMLYRYAAYSEHFGIGSGFDPDALNSFRDWEKVSPYARDAMAWAVSQGLINGASSTLLDPAGEASRAQSAAIWHRFHAAFSND